MMAVEPSICALGLIAESTASRLMVHLGGRVRIVEFDQREHVERWETGETKKQIPGTGREEI